MNPLKFAIIGDDRSGKAFAGVVKGLGGVGNALGEAQRKMTAFGQSARRVGGAMSVAVTAPLAGLGASTLRAAGDFEAGMNRVQALSNATGGQFDALREQAKTLGRTTQFSATQAADAMGFLAMAGFDANKIVGAMPGTLNLAAAAQMDLAETADVVSNVLTGFQRPVEDLAEINDVLVKTMTRTNTDLGMLGSAFKFVGPVAAAAGVDFNETAAAIGLLGNAGIQGEMAGTALRGAITKILNPTKKARGVMQELGLELVDTAGKIKPLDDLIVELAPHADNAGAFMELFGQRAGPGMLALVNQGAGALRDLTAELENSGGTAGRIAESQMKGFNGAMKELRSAFEGLQIAIADSGLLDAFTGMVKGLTGFVQEMAKADPQMLKFAATVAGFAAIAGPLIGTLGLLSIGIGAISAPVLATVAAIGVATAAFVAFGDEIGAFIENPAAAVTRWGESLKTTGSAALKTFGTAANETFEAVAGAIDKAIPGAGAEMLAFRDRVVAVGTRIYESLPNSIAEAVALVAQALSGMVTDTMATLSGWKTAFMETVVGFRDAVVKTVTGIFTAISGEIDRVFEAVTGLGARLKNAILGGEEAISIPMAVGPPSASEVAQAKAAYETMIATTEFAPLEFEALEGGASVQRMASDTATAMQQINASSAIGRQAFGSVSEAARVMEDEVTGNSYVPDMVTAVIAHFKRMDGEGTPVAVGAFGAVREAAEGISGAITGTLRSALVTGKADFSAFGDSLVSIGTRMADRMLDRVFQPIEEGLVSILSGSTAKSGGGGGIFGSLVSGVGGLLGNAFAGFYADGGTIGAGMFGIVGERGPEIAYGGSGGLNIAPIRAGGGGTVVNQGDIIIQGNADRGSIREIDRLLRRQTDATIAEIDRRRLQGLV